MSRGSLGETVWGGSGDGQAAFTPKWRAVHTHGALGAVRTGSELGDMVGRLWGVWGVQAWGMLYFGGGVTVVWWEITGRSHQVVGDENSAQKLWQGRR